MLILLSGYLWISAPILIMCRKRLRVFLTEALIFVVLWGASSGLVISGMFSSAFKLLAVAAVAFGVFHLDLLGFSAALCNYNYD